MVFTVRPPAAGSDENSASEAANRLISLAQSNQLIILDRNNNTLRIDASSISASVVTGGNGMCFILSPGKQCGT